MKKILKLFVISIMILSCVTYAACGISPEKNELETLKETAVIQFNEYLSEINFGDYDAPFMQIYFDNAITQIRTQLKTASSKEDIERIIYGNRRSVNNLCAYLRNMRFSFGGAYMKAYKFQNEDISLAVTGFLETSPVSFTYDNGFNIVTSQGISVKIYYGDGISVLNGENLSYEISAGREQLNTHKIYFKSTIYAGADQPSYDTTKSYYLYFIFEKDGFALGYIAVDLLTDKTIKAAIYETSENNKVTCEKTLEYIEKAKHHKNGEKVDGIRYYPLDIIYNYYADPSPETEYTGISCRGSKNQLYLALSDSGEYCVCVPTAANFR